MLVLSRKAGEKIRIANDITVVVLDVKGNRIRLGVEAPLHMCIVRQELLEADASGNTVHKAEAPEAQHAAGHP